VTIPRIPDGQATKSRIPCPNFGQSRFPGSSQFPNPVKISFVFPNPAPYFGEIPDPENTLLDPVVLLANGPLVALFTCTPKHSLSELTQFCMISFVFVTIKVFSRQFLPCII